MIQEDCRCIGTFRATPFRTVDGRQVSLSRKTDFYKGGELDKRGAAEIR